MTPEQPDSLAERLLGRRRTKLGGLHIDHARRVATAVAAVADLNVVAAALLHDVLEKTAVRAEELGALTGDPDLVALVVTLTRPPAESEESYLARCAANPAALVVKQADLADKLESADARVSAAVAARVRRTAAERLALLERLAGATQPS